MSYIGYRDGSTTMVGWSSDHLVRPITDVATFWSDAATRRFSGTDSGVPLPLRDLTLAVPVPPAARIVCVGLNYADHAAEGPFSVPEHPEYFARWTPALGVSGAAVEIPDGEPGLDWEAELAVVVGDVLRDVEPDRALEGIFGFAAFNDLTARRAQHRGSQWTLGKNVDGSGVLGPIVPAAMTGDPARGWGIEAMVNGEIVQSSTTDKLIFDVGTLLSDLSRVLTLHPGDILATGTPEGVGHRRTPPRFLHDGDEVVVRIDGLGQISTPIRNSPVLSRPGTDPR